VKTHLVKKDGGIVRLDYYFRDGLIFNVVADGVSDLSLRRADYASIIGSEGLGGLRRSIRDSIEEYRSSDAP
jgi:phospholipid transport system substrate-binding protein